MSHPYPTLPPEVIESPAPRGLLAWWSRLRGTRSLPARGDFIAEDLAPWWPDLILYDVVGTGESARFRFRLQGENVVASDGGNFSGQFLDDVLPARVAPSIIDAYKTVLQVGKPLYTRLSRPSAQGFPADFERLLLPLGDSPQKISMILVHLVRTQTETRAATGNGLNEGEKPYKNDYVGFIEA